MHFINSKTLLIGLLLQNKDIIKILMLKLNIYVDFLLNIIYLMISINSFCYCLRLNYTHDKYSSNIEWIIKILAKQN